MKRGVPVRYPVVSCNHTPEYLRGFYPRPAGIDLGPRLLARLALNELFCAITGEDIQKNKITTIVTPVLVPAYFGSSPRETTGECRSAQNQSRS